MFKLFDAFSTTGRRSQAHRWLLVLMVRGAGGIAGAASTLCASRMLGADSAGTVFLSLAVITFLSTLSRLGLDNAIVRSISVYASKEQWDEINATLKLAMKWAAITSLGVAVALFVLANFLAVHVFEKPALTPVFRIMSWLIPLMSLYWLSAQGFIGLRRPEIATTLQNSCVPFSFILLLVFGCIVLPRVPREIIAAVAYTAAGLITFFSGALLWARHVRSSSFAVFIDSDALRRSALPLWAVAVMAQAVTWSSQIAAGAWLSAKDVAHLAAAQRCALLISLVLLVTNMIIAPQFAAMHHEDDISSLRTLTHRATRMMTFIATPIATLMIMSADFIMRLFGEDFSAAAPLLQILVLGQWFNVVTGSVGMLLQMTGHERDMRNIAIISGALSILLACFMTSHFGAKGAACATAIGLSVQTGAAVLMVKRRLGFFSFG